MEPTGGNDTAMGMLCCPGPKEFPQAGASDYSRFQSKCSLNELCVTVLIPEQIKILKQEEEEGDGGGGKEWES